jgi:hypothetical protein
MNKRGSHVGMMLSFVLFVTAVIFIYTFIEPSLQTGEDKEQLLKQIKEKLPEYFEENLLNLKISLTQDCCENKNCFSIEQDSKVSSLELIVKDKQGNEIKSESSSDKIKIEKVEENYLNLFFANTSFVKQEASLEDCNEIDTDSYTYALTSKKYYFQSRIENFILNSSDKKFYEETKNNFYLPEGTEFRISFIYENGSKLGKNPENISTSIFVEQFSIYYVNSTADTNPGFIEISVW